VRPASLSFPGYEDFTFHDAMPYRGSALTLDLGEVRTDAQGRAVLPLPLAGSASPPRGPGRACRCRWKSCAAEPSIAAFLSKALSRAADVP